MSDRKRLLTDLRVIDLRAELEKRNLDKSGVRGVLIQRLAKYLKDEGHDPDTFRFDMIGTETKSPAAKRTRRSTVEETESEETPAMEDMIVQDTAGEEEETEQPQDAAPEETSAVTETAPSPVPDNDMEVDTTDKVNRKRDIKDEPEATEAKKPCLVKDEDLKLENNTDPEDSINLDLGEDELLNEETDPASKSKDEAGSGDAAETACDDAAPDDSAAADDAAVADDHQVNAEAPATSNDGESEEKDKKDGKVKSDNAKAEKKDDSKEGGARNLWVSGLSGDTRAKDLKQLCSKHGKVIGAKVVTNARTPGSRCYGYVTMANAQDAEQCIKCLHRTELHGRMISVEKAKSESESTSRRQPSRAERRSSKETKDEEAKEGESKMEPKKKEDGASSTRSTSRTREKSHRSDRKERDVARARERSRAAREEERRRRAAEDALRERERRQRQEKHRLALEREKLRAEREKIEREKNELLKLERERHRLEREKLELERLELKRAQLRLEEERRKRGYESSASYRKPVASPPPEPAYDRERHKRAPLPALASNRGQFEAPPPPRFDVASYDRGADKRDRDRDRDYKRDYQRHVSSGNVKYPSNGSANDDGRQPMPPGTRPKEPPRSYDSRDSRPYRPSPPGKPEPRSWTSSNRYPDAAAPSKGSLGSGSGEAWSGSEPRYGGAYDTRYPPAYQPPPPGATYPDRYPPTREYRKY